MTKLTHLVLGASGFVGRHVALRLAGAGYTVLTAGRHAPPPPPAGSILGPIEHITFDMTSGDWDGLIKRCDIVHHCAWELDHRSPSPASLTGLRNVIATISLLEAMRRHGGKRLIFVSSGGSVYGRLRAVPVTELHPLDPITAYGAAKVAAEKYIGVFRAQHGVDGRIARLANAFGAGQNPAGGQGAVAAFLDRVSHGQEISIWGDGSVVRDYIHIADAVEALLRLSLSPLVFTAPETPVFNIGSGEGRSLNQIVDAIRALTGKTVEIKYSAARPSDVPVNILDIERASADLDWRPQLSFEEGLARTHTDIAAGRTTYSTLG